MIVGFLAFLALSGPVQHGAAVVGPALSVCEVSRHPRRYVGKRITINAVVHNVLPHGILLDQDGSGRGCRGIWAGNNAPGGGDVLQLAVDPSSPHRVRVTGTFKSVKRWSDVFQSSENAYELDDLVIERVR